MYAVIQTGGKQYRVAPGDTIRIERVEGKVGEKVNFGNVLAVHGDAVLSVGLPMLRAGSVSFPIRVVQKDGKPLFVAVDVCRAVGLTNPSEPPAL